MLSVSNLIRTYGDFVAVDDISFSIGKGEIVGLLGHNGAGKTTIMKVISGYLEANSGSVSIGDIDIADDPKRAQCSIGYLPESLPIYPELSVVDYLDYAAELKGLSGEVKKNEIKRAIFATDITEKLLAPINQLSRGFKQRVGVAQAILGQPKLLILDEPTNGLDPTQTEHMRELIRDIAREATVILSTHIMQEVDALCDRALIIKKGRLIVDEKLEHLRQSNLLLISSTMTPEQMKALADGLDGVVSLSATGRDERLGSSDYRIGLSQGSESKYIASQLSKAIIASGNELFQLQCVERNLESLFHDANVDSNKASLEEGSTRAA
ncbi:MAG: multidrug ABC transporter ATP-binding protein [Alteromonadaceae bacterium]|nr:MAG: multidrug ABC transporter ATP-binding protein [Alteromonadaceae bacterium]